MNSIYNINAKEEILNLLKDDLNDERVKQELSQLVDINYIELLLAKCSQISLLPSVLQSSTNIISFC